MKATLPNAWPGLAATTTSTSVGSITVDQRIRAKLRSIRNLAEHALQAYERADANDNVTPGVKDLTLDIRDDVEKILEMCDPSAHPRDTTSTES